MRIRHSKSLLGLGILAAAAALSGCNSMSAQECLATDWRTVGYEDGVNGYTGDRIGHYRKACSEHGVTPNLEQYQAGREQGLREFCKPANGFRVGSTQDEIYALRSESEQIERNLVTVGAQMIDPTTTTEQRAQLVLDTKHMHV